jgi:hypothetical protein
MKNMIKVMALITALTGTQAFAQDAMQLAAQGLSSCAQAFPDGRKAAKAFKTLGFTSQGDVQGVSTYSGSGGAVLVATSSVKSQKLRCMATTSGMSVAQAKALAQSVLPMLQGAADSGIKIGGIEAFWTGKLNGKSAGLVVAGPTGDGLGASVTIVLN